MPASESAAFVLCIEDNGTRDQALLLVESIRAFAGALADAPILAVAPRDLLGVDAATRARLAALGVTYLEERLNTAAPWYASANRVVAAAWAAEHLDADVLFVLDSDALLLGEPELPGAGCDLAVRPVDVKGCTSSGPGDPAEPYWRAFAGLAGIDVDELPWVETVLDRRTVRASYNGGYAAVRRRSGILQRSAELLVRSLHAGLLPTAGNPQRVVASTGAVSTWASRHWGTNQAALSLAAWSTTRAVRLLDRRYNVPLHGLADPAYGDDGWRDLRPVHVHLHWMLEPPHRARGLALLRRLGVEEAQLRWIGERVEAIAAEGRRGAPAVAVPRPAGRQVVVTGMHRSGTSLVASALRRAGVDLGRELGPADRGNPRGHFEDVDFHRFHEALLASAGHTCFTADGPLVPSPGLAAQARRLVAERAARPLWGWKDPRTCLALDLWDELLPDARWIFLFRHPVDVALSLWRRDSNPELRLDPWLAMRSWEVHNLLLLELRARHPERCVLARVPEATADLAGLVRAVAARFGLPLRVDGVGALYAPGELAPRLGETAAWRDLLGGPLALFDELEAAAELPVAEPSPAAAVERARPAGDLALAERLLLALLAATRPAPPGEAVPVAGAREPEAALRRLADLEDELATATARRDELAQTLAAMEGARGVRLLRGWWALRDRLRGGRR